MNASWYDLLDVSPDATEDEIKSAWKAAIADLDPTDRKFRVYNQAAEVLLDPQKRAAYDAELPESERAEAAEAEASEETTAAPIAEPTDPAPAHVAADDPPRRRGAVPGWLLAVVAALTAVAVGACAYVWFEKPSDASLDESTRAAQSAAERAIGPILSYNALHLDEDQKAAETYMTADYRKDYDDLFAVIKQNAPATKTIVKAQVIASGVVRSGEDRVDVLLFVNRPTTNKLVTEPVVYKDQVTVTMQKVDGDWLVDDLVTSPVAR
jgi:Mce-associated membrane protein